MTVNLFSQVSSLLLLPHCYFCADSELETGYAGRNASLNSIAQRPGYDSQILVAGGFASAGSLPCQSICLWDTEKLQWSGLGGGLQGVVGAMDFAGVSRFFPSPCKQSELTL